MSTWLTVLSIFLGSTLVLEIYRNIRDAIQRKRTKKMMFDELPQQIKQLDSKVGQLADTSTKEFQYIKGRLDSDHEHFTKIDRTLDQMQEAMNHNAEGTALGLANDIVIFNAFRDHHINGESELAERRVNDYLLKNMQDRISI